MTIKQRRPHTIGQSGNAAALWLEMKLPVVSSMKLLLDENAAVKRRPAINFSVQLKPSKARPPRNSGSPTTPHEEASISVNLSINSSPALLVIGAIAAQRHWEMARVKLYLAGFWSVSAHLHPLPYRQHSQPARENSDVGYDEVKIGQ